VGGVAQTFDGFYTYRVTPTVASGVTDLRSDNTFASTAPNAHDFEYTTTVYCLDEMAGGQERSMQASEGGGSSGFFTVDDLDRLLLADINRDGAVDDSDTLELFERLAIE
jgi:hypothetical protein